jgi:hypothetical protein
LLTNQYLWDSQFTPPRQTLASGQSQQSGAKCNQRCSFAFDRHGYETIEKPQPTRIVGHRTLHPLTLDPLGGEKVNLKAINATLTTS